MKRSDKRHPFLSEADQAVWHKAFRKRKNRRIVHQLFTIWDDPELLRLSESDQTQSLPIIMRFLDEGKQSGDIDASLDNEAIFAYFPHSGP
jgi:hypothetical protein